MVARTTKAIGALCKKPTKRQLKRRAKKQNTWKLKLHTPRLSNNANRAIHTSFDDHSKPPILYSTDGTKAKTSTQQTAGVRFKNRNGDLLDFLAQGPLGAQRLHFR